MTTTATLVSREHRNAGSKPVRDDSRVSPDSSGFRKAMARTTVEDEPSVTNPTHLADQGRSWQVRSGTSLSRVPVSVMREEDPVVAGNEEPSPRATNMMLLSIHDLRVTSTSIGPPQPDALSMGDVASMPAPSTPSSLSLTNSEAMRPSHAQKTFVAQKITLHPPMIARVARDAALVSKAKQHQMDGGERRSIDSAHASISASEIRAFSVERDKRDDMAGTRIGSSGPTTPTISSAQAVDRMIGSVSAGLGPAAAQVLHAIIDRSSSNATETSGTESRAPLSDEKPTPPIRTMTLNLSPDWLGSVEIRMTLSPETLRIDVQADRTETAASLEIDRDTLVDRLSLSGYASVDVAIGRAPSRPEIPSDTATGSASQSTARDPGRGAPSEQSRREERPTHPDNCDRATSAKVSVDPQSDRVQRTRRWSVDARQAPYTGVRVLRSV